MGCGQLIYSKNGRPIHIEGDPRSPINQGTLCPKGSGTLGMLLSPKRVSTVLYRAPHAKQWEAQAARLGDGAHRAAHQADARRHVRGDAAGRTDHQPDHRAGSLGGATMDNEENYLIKKLFGGGLGMVNIENQARI